MIMMPTRAKLRVSHFECVLQNVIKFALMVFRWPASDSFYSSFLMCTIGSDSSEIIVQLLVCPCKNLVGQDYYDHATRTPNGRLFFPLSERGKSFVDGEGVIVLLMDFRCTMTDMLESECKVYSFWSATSSSHNSLKKNSLLYIGQRSIFTHLCSDVPSSSL